jgi:hypothetical protein
MGSIIPRKNCSFRGIPKFTEESIPRLGTEGNGLKKISFTKNSAPAIRIDSIFRRRHASERNSESFLLFLFRETEFRVVFSSAGWFGTEFQLFASIGVPGNGIPRLISLPRNGSERNSETLLLLLFHGTEFRAFFSSSERFGTEFREFSVPRNSRNSAGTNQMFRPFRLPRNNFLVGNCQPFSSAYLCAAVRLCRQYH